MEEVDSIIFHFLSQLNVEITEDIKSVSDMPVELIIQSVAKCLNTINPNLKVPKSLPSGVSHRIELAAQIAVYCKDLGYKNDVGYQTFLYCNESDLRQVFMFLIEHLPSERKQAPDFSSEKSVLLRNISNKISKELNKIWIPQSCHNNNKTLGDNSQAKMQKDLAANEKDLICKLRKIKKYKTQLSKASENHNTLGGENQLAEGEIQHHLEISQSLKELKETSVILQQKLNSMESERNIRNFEYEQARKSYENAEGELKNVLNILKDVGIDNIEIRNINNSIDILREVQKSIESLHVQSEELTSNNLAIKLDIDKYRNKNSSTDCERNKCRNTLIALKETAKSYKDEYDNKEKLREQLKKNYSKLRNGNKRSIYTKRILEIISNVDKQNLEIKKVLDDSRELQKEINTLEGQLDRCFSIADETLFGDAKKDDQAKKAYKLLALLHSECNTIVSLINETGTLAREIVDLEDKIKAEKTKRTEDTLEKIKLDLTRMHEESAR